MNRTLAIAACLLAATSVGCYHGTPASARRAEVARLGWIRMRVADLEQSRHFYKDILELREYPQKCFDPEGSCFWISFGIKIELLPIRNNSEKTGIDQIGFWASELPTLRKELIKAGFKASQIRTGQAEQRLFEVADPEGHLILFFSPTEGGSQVFSPISHHLIHAGFVVHDRAAMDHFYKDVLGFRLYWSGGMKDNETDWVSMQVPDGTDWIEYMLNIPDNADKHLLGIMNHISLGVSDVRETARQLEAKGIKLPEPPKIGRDGKWQLNLYDPDDTRVELMEFTPVEKPCCSEYTGPHPKP